MKVCYPWGIAWVCLGWIDVRCQILRYGGNWNTLKIFLNFITAVVFVGVISALFVKASMIIKRWCSSIGPAKSIWMLCHGTVDSSIHFDLVCTFYMISLWFQNTCQCSFINRFRMTIPDVRRREVQECLGGWESYLGCRSESSLLVVNIRCHYSRNANFFLFAECAKEVRFKHIWFEHTNRMPEFKIFIQNVPNHDYVFIYILNSKHVQNIDISLANFQSKD